MENSVFNASTNEWWVNGTQRFTNIHRTSSCAGENCIVHTPSDCVANREDWAYVFRTDGRIERMCNHGIGHPDPDQARFLLTANADIYGEWIWIHACDGCCVEGEKDE